MNTDSERDGSARTQVCVAEIKTIYVHLIREEDSETFPASISFKDFKELKNKLILLCGVEVESSISVSIVLDKKQIIVSCDLIEEGCNYDLIFRLKEKSLKLYLSRTFD